LAVAAPYIIVGLGASVVAAARGARVWRGGAFARQPAGKRAGMV